MAARTLPRPGPAPKLNTHRLTERKAIAEKTGAVKERKGKKIHAKDMSVAIRQLATMISSGLTLVRALGVLAQQTSHAELTRIFTAVRDDVERGRSLSESCAKHPRAFGRLGIAMVRAGETGGVLDITLERLAVTLEKEAELRRKVKSAMTYPVVIGGLAMLIVSGMLIIVVPTFETLYADLDGELPAPTKILIGISRVVRSGFLFLILLGAGGLMLFKRWRETPKGRRTIDAALLKIPMFGPLFRKTALARFSRTLASMLRAGVPVLQALDITRETVGNTVIGDAVAYVGQQVSEGSAIAPPMQQSGVFPPMLVQMIAVGEETGSVDELCDKVADHLSSEVDATVNALASLVEPILIAFLGLVIGGMVISLYMPMFKLVEIVG
jgi:type IV pilus assembly protein PilC